MLRNYPDWAENTAWEGSPVNIPAKALDNNYLPSRHAQECG